MQNSRSRQTSEGKSSPRPSNSETRGPDNTASSNPGLESTGLLTDEIRELIRLVELSDITELAIENGAQKIHIKREKQYVTYSEPAPVASVRNQRPPRNHSHSSELASDIPPIPDPGAPPEDSFHKVVAPMVGTFYRSPDPKARPFVSEGEMVEKGQVIGIIEAMKIMNEIVSEHTGRCAKVNVENGQPVEYGQTLILLEPV